MNLIGMFKFKRVMIGRYLCNFILPLYNYIYYYFILNFIFIIKKSRQIVI